MGQNSTWKRNVSPVAVALNAGALGWLTGGAESLADGVALARDALASGSPAERLGRWIEVTRDA